MSDPEQEFQPGQLVEYTGLYKAEFGGTWEVVGCDGESRDRPGCYIWKVKRSPDAPVNRFYNTSLKRPGRLAKIFNTSMKLVNKTTDIKGCTCSINDLMAKGCTCGQMVREKTT